MKWTAFILVALADIVCLHICGGCASTPGKEQQFWDKFKEINSAWLDPQPPAMSYNVIRDDWTSNPQGKYFWEHRETQKADIWCAPGKNARSITYNYSPDGKMTIVPREMRYFNGKGNEFTNPPQEATRHLFASEWIADRIGASFVTSLHLVSAFGFPPNAQIIEKGQDRVILKADKLFAGRDWETDHFSYPIYGIHPAIFSGDVQLNLDAFEAEIDTRTMLPVRITETDAGGEKIIVQFEEPWLKLNGKYVPGKAAVEFPKQELTVRFTFQVKDGVWIATEVVNDYPKKREYLRSRSTIQSFRVGPLDMAMFKLPTDTTLPDHSYTTLGKGERIIEFKTRDGLILEGKLSLPPNAKEPAPVVFWLHGSGPWTFDRPVQYPDPKSKDLMFADMKMVRYLDFYAKELNKRGIGFFRTNKRGCAISNKPPYELVRRGIFSKTTPSLLVEDYKCALDTLRQQPDIDKNKIVLLGASEGTVTGPSLALASPKGIAAVVMMGYAEDNTRDILVWQSTVGPFRNLCMIFDSNNDSRITEAEYDARCVKSPIIKSVVQFSKFDIDKNGVIIQAEAAKANKPTLNYLMKAVKDRDDDWLWKNVVNLSSAHLLEEWDRPPLHKTLLKLNIPLAIFHGELDGSVRVEGAREAKAAFQKAGKKNLKVYIYPKTDHNLNWTDILKGKSTPKPFEDVFAFIKSVVTAR